MEAALSPMAWKPNLEAGLRALDGHFVELCLRVLGQAGVAGIVGVWSFHRRGSRAQRAIHEAFQQAGMQHGIVGVVMGAHLDQIFERRFEGQPLGDAQIELALLFELFEDEKVLPVAEVLHAGYAVGEGVGDGQLVAAPALVVAGRRNDLFDQFLRRLAQNAGRLAIGVEIDGSALRRNRFCR